MAGIEGHPSIIRERKRRGSLDALTSDVADGLTSFKQELLERPVISFRYAGQQ
jgi:hypothetical protein